MKKIGFAILSALLLLSCAREVEPEVEVELSCISGAATGLTHKEATLNGWVSVKGEADWEDGFAYFYYSQNKGKVDSLIKSACDSLNAGRVLAGGGLFRGVVDSLLPEHTYYYVAVAEMNGMELVGNVRSFTTKPIPKNRSVTGETEAISEFSVLLSGFVYPPEVDTVEKRRWGIDYCSDSLMTNPVRRFCHDALDKDNAYVVRFDSLAHNTDYYYRAFVIEEEKEYFYGDTLSFRTLDVDLDEDGRKIEIVTDPIDSTYLTEFRAKVSASLKLRLTSRINKQVWFRFGPDKDKMDSIAVDISKYTLYDTLSFSYSNDSLTCGQTYYYQPMARISYRGVFEKVYEGEIKSFNTLEISPLIVTEDPDELTEFRATMRGSLSTDNKEILNKDVWFRFGSDAADLRDSVHTVLEDDGTFKYRLHNLEYGKEYHYMAFCKIYDRVISGYRVFHGKAKSFSTLDITANITTGEATGITEFTAELSALLSEVSNSSFSKSVWFVYGTDVSDLRDTVRTVADDDGVFKAGISGLDYGTTYYYQAFARVYDKVFSGEIRSFDTIPVEADVTTGDATGITEFQARLSGSLDDRSRDVLEKALNFYVSDTGTTAEELRESGRKIRAEWIGDGKFCCSLDALKAGTQYHYVACLKVKNTEFFGSVRDFSTIDVVAELSDVSKTVGVVDAELSCAVTDTDINNIGRSVSFFVCPADGLMDVADPQVLPDSTRARGRMFKTTFSVEADRVVYNCRLTGLNPGTDYVCVVCLSAYDNDYLGGVNSFTTGVITDLLTTNEASEITEYSARLSCHLNYDPDASISFYYSPDWADADNLILHGTRSRSSYNPTTGFHEYRIDGLTYGTRYYFVPVVFTGGKNYPGVVKDFTTLDITAVVSTDPAVSVTYHEAVLSGSIASASNISLFSGAMFLCADSPSPEKWDTVYVKAGSDPTSFSAGIAGLDSGKDYYYKAHVFMGPLEFEGPVVSFTTKTPPDGTVDLGLDVCWATMNVGAATPEENGDYYSWTDDIAVPSGWRIPTHTDFENLRKYCTWTKKFKDEVFIGYIVSSNLNDNSIFIPAAGYYSGTEHITVDNGLRTSEAPRDETPLTQVFFFRFNSSTIGVQTIPPSVLMPVRLVAE